MIGYVFAGLAVFANIFKAYGSKKSSLYVENVSENSLCNLLRMVFCVAIGAVLVGVEGTSLQVDVGTLGIMVLSGVSNAVIILTWLAATQRGALMLLNVFYMLSVLVPMILCRVLYQEPIRLIQWLGLAVLLAAVWIMCSYNKSLGGRLSWANLAILLTCALSGGLADFSQKMFLNHDPSGSNNVFQFYTFLFASLLLLAVYWTAKRKAALGGRLDFGREKVLFRQVFGYIVMLSASMFAYSWLKTTAAMYLTSAQLYPFFQGINLIAIAIMSAVCFGEKITLRSLVGMVLAFVALIMMNLL